MVATVRRFVAALTIACAAGAAVGQSAPAADHHQHVFSPSMVTLLSPATGGGPPAITASDVVALLDAAGIGRAALLSTAYLYGAPTRAFDDEYARVRAENDWTAAEVARYPDRLRGFCGFNPLKDYALDELARCAAVPHLRHGIKLHFGNSDVQLEDPAHVERVRRVFEAANAKRMAIVVHLRASISRKRPYGAEQARVFLEELLPAAPDVPVQVAHLASAGPGYADPPAHDVMRVLADAVERGDPRTRTLWFDIATVVDANISTEHAVLVARFVRQVGARRVLYGSDAAAGTNLRPRESWAAIRRLPLSEAEFTQIAANLAPYLR